MEEIWRCGAREEAGKTIKDGLEKEYDSGEKI